MNSSLKFQICITFGSFVIGILVSYFRLGFSFLDSIFLSGLLIPIWFLFYRYVIKYEIIETKKDRTSKLPITIGESR